MSTVALSQSKTNPVKTPLPKTNEDISKYYPDVEVPISPFGDRVVVQVQAPREKVGSIYLSVDAQEGDKWNQQTAKVVALGPIAVDMMDKLGYAIGDFVRVPLYGGDKVEVRTKLTSLDSNTVEVAALFVTYRAHEIIGRVMCDPLIIKTIV